MCEPEPIHLLGKPEPQGWGRQWCLSASFLIVSFFSFILTIMFVTSGTCRLLPAPFTNRYKFNDKSLGLWLPYQCANHGTVSSPETNKMFALSPSLAVTMACFHTVITACHFPPLVLRVWDKVLTSTVWEVICTVPAFVILNCWEESGKLQPGILCRTGNPLECALPFPLFISEKLAELIQTFPLNIASNYNFVISQKSQKGFW